MSKLLLLYASETEEVETLSFGSVGVILGCKYTRTGDTLTAMNNTKDDATLPNIVPPPPVMSISVLPQSQSDVEPVQEALEALSRTDPSVRVESQEGQIIVHGLGALHLEIVESRLRDEWGAKFEFGAQRVSYREGFGSLPIDDVLDTWSTEIAGKPVQVSVSFDVRSLQEHEQGDPVWAGNMVLDESGAAIGLPESFTDKSNPLGLVSRGILDALSSSPHTALAHSRIRVQVKNFRYPPTAFLVCAGPCRRKRSHSSQHHQGSGDRGPHGALYTRQSHGQRGDTREGCQGFDGARR